MTEHILVFDDDTEAEIEAKAKRQNLTPDEWLEHTIIRHIGRLAYRSIKRVIDKV